MCVSRNGEGNRKLCLLIDLTVVSGQNCLYISCDADSLLGNVFPAQNALNGV